MFKRILCGLSLTAFLIGGIIVGNTETYYNSAMTVETVDTASHAVFVKDSRGAVWSYYYDQIAPKEGDKIVYKMYTNHTDNTNDDEIVGIVR